MKVEKINRNTTIFKVEPDEKNKSIKQGNKAPDKKIKENQEA